MSSDSLKLPRKSVGPVWWLASIVFHAVLLGWLIFFSPVRVIDLAAKPAAAAPKVSPAREAKVMEQVREQQAENLAGEVRALEEARRELAGIEARKRDELRQKSAGEAASIESVAAAQENATKAQAAAAAALNRAQDEWPAEAVDAAALARVTAGIHEAQTSANQFQAEALEALALAEAKFEPVYQAQATANAAQSHAAQALAEAEGQLSGAAALRAKNAPKGDDLQEAKEMLREAETQLTTANASIQSLNESLPQLRAGAESAKVAFDAATASGDKAQITVTKKAASTAQKAADNAQKNLNRAQQDVPKFQQRITNQTARIAKFSGESGPTGLKPELIQRNAAEKLQEAQRLQAQAIAAQTQAAKALTDARQGVASSSPPLPKSGEDLAGVYQAAVNTEGEMTEAYRRLRATDLAMQRQIPLARALDLVDAARTSRPDLAASLTASAGGSAQREAIMEARAQIGAMRSLAESMLAQARSSGAGTGPQQMDQLAAEDENQRAKDLTGAMRRGAGGGAGKTGAGSGSSGSGSGSAGSGGTGSSGSGSGSGAGGGEGSGTGAGSGAGSGLSSGGLGDGSGSAPPPIPKDLAALPGRVIGAGAVPGRWMFIDSWYLLGPFDNAGRANLEKQFPPETVVDLNATYVGKRGTAVRWEFFQSPHPRVVPPFDHYNPLVTGISDGGANGFKARDLEYIIYYGYTELRAAEECDVWISIGSDDFSKLWIEDQLVWASGKKLKTWRVDEGSRKVHLQKGVNRVLIRVENGHSQSEFSLAACLP